MLYKLMVYRTVFLYFYLTRFEFSVTTAVSKLEEAFPDEGWFPFTAGQDITSADSKSITIIL